MDTISNDVLRGGDAIADYLGLTRRQAYHAIAAGHIPTFRVGAIVCARKSTLLSWIAKQESDTNDNASPGQLTG